jgi:hypothetical protein
MDCLVGMDLDVNTQKRHENLSHEIKESTNKYHVNAIQVETKINKTCMKSKEDNNAIQKKTNKNEENKNFVRQASILLTSQM